MSFLDKHDPWYPVYVLLLIVTCCSGGAYVFHEKAACEKRGGAYVKAVVWYKCVKSAP